MAWGNIRYANQGATRNKPIVQALGDAISSTVKSVFGAGYTAEIYSGGQDWQGEGSRRVGSTRHDGGNAADVYIYDPSGRRVTDDAQLGKLAQTWLARKTGGVGYGMANGGTHLDIHQDRASSWTYRSVSDTIKNALSLGKKGVLPDGVTPSGEFPARAPRIKVTRAGTVVLVASEATWAISSKGAVSSSSVSSSSVSVSRSSAKETSSSSNLFRPGEGNDRGF